MWMIWTVARGTSQEAVRLGCPSVEASYWGGAGDWFDCLTCAQTVEARRGARDQAREYCWKEATRGEGPWEYGMWIGGPGHRSDIDVMLGALGEGKTEREILQCSRRVWGKTTSGLSGII